MANLLSPVHFPREQVLRAVAATAAPGGLLLIVDHASVPPWSWADPDTRLPTPKQLASLELPVGQWHPERLDSPSRTATGPGRPATVTDNVVALRHLVPRPPPDPPCRRHPALPPASTPAGARRSR